MHAWRMFATVAVVAGAAACAPAAEPGAPAGTVTPQVDVRCQPFPDAPVAGRVSPYDSTVIVLGDSEAKVCYGRPAARGRTMIGGTAVPYGRLWRTGANEPTTLHLPVAARIAGIALQPGSYSIYTIPGPTEWTVILNRSITQWGHESEYTEEVRAQEVGRATVPSEQITEHVEVFTIRSEPAGADRADMILEWEHTRVRVPIVRTS